MTPFHPCLGKKQLFLLGLDPVLPAESLKHNQRKLASWCGISGCSEFSSLQLFSSLPTVKDPSVVPTWIDFKATGERTHFCYFCTEDPRS